MTRSALYLGAAVLAVALHTGIQAGDQVIAPTPSAIAIGSGGMAGFDVMYDTSPSDPSLPGIGFSMHWDSTKLGDPVVSNLLTASLVSQQILPDTKNLDGDPATDRRLLVAWLDASGAWPGTLPQRLFTVAFPAATGFAVGSTSTIRFVKVSSAAQWTFVGSPATVAMVAVPPSASVSGGGTISLGESISIQAALTGTAPWSLTWSDGFPQSGLLSSPVVRTVSPVTTTVYTVTAASDANGAGTSSGSATVTVRVPCVSWTVSPTALSPLFWADSEVVTVSGNPAGCGGTWTASNDGNSWLTVNPTSGVQGGTTTISWTQNNDTGARSGSVTISGTTIPVSQQGKPAYLCTAVNGSISSNTSWTLAGSPYCVNGAVTVAAGATLSVEPGVVVKFAQTTGLYVYGTLNAAGASGLKVYFTDNRDDTVGGDTNGDGTGTSPAAGWWYGIQVMSGGSAAIDRAEIRYGGYTYCSGICVGNGANLYKTGTGDLSFTHSVSRDAKSSGIYLSGATGTVTLSGNTMSSSGYGIVTSGATGAMTISGNMITVNAFGVFCDGSSPAIMGNTITGGQYGLYVAGASVPVSVTGNVLNSNTVASVYLRMESSGMVVADDNVFTGPIHVGPGTLTASLSWGNKQTYFLEGNARVGAGATLTIEPGVVVKIQQSAGLFVDASGMLNVTGTPGARAYFTDSRDDTVGGDTNGDGSATSPAAGSWIGIEVNEGGTASIDWAEIRYGGYTTTYVGHNANLYKTGAGSLSFMNSVSRNSSFGIRLNGATGTVTVTGNTLTSNSSFGIYCVGSSPTISGNTVTGGAFSLYVTGPAVPSSVTGNTFSGFTTAAVYMDLAASGMAVADDNVFTGPLYVASSGTFPANVTWGNNRTYYLPGSVTVPSGATLAITGHPVKFAQATGLYVSGTLNVTGTPGARAYFTDSRDPGIPHSAYV